MIRRAFDEEPTVAIPFETMRTLVFGVALAVGGCAATAPAPAVEPVGALAPSYRSIATAPVHATTDFGHAEVVGSADDEEKTVVIDAAEMPDVAAKDGGLRAGAVRQ